MKLKLKATSTPKIKKKFAEILQKKIIVVWLFTPCSKMFSFEKTPFDPERNKQMDFADVLFIIPLSNNKTM